MIVVYGAIGTRIRRYRCATEVGAERQREPGQQRTQLDQHSKTYNEGGLESQDYMHVEFVRSGFSTEESCDLGCIYRGRLSMTSFQLESASSSVIGQFVSLVLFLHRYFLGGAGCHLSFMHVSGHGFRRINNFVYVVERLYR